EDFEGLGLGEVFEVFVDLLVFGEFELGGDVGGFEGVGEGFGFGKEVFGLGLEVKFIVGKGFGEFLEMGLVGGVFKGGVGHQEVGGGVGEGG
ncbi:hypothetical protein, partial [Neisseria sicca]|uniref:hypothetical protein n=1 Tax=Neisseria sicca TaxID=490 RepID=UPI001C990A83